MKTSVIIADDHPLTRKGLFTYLSQIEDISVVAETEDSASTIAMTEKLIPDVIIMDISLPGINGIEITKLIKKQFPQISIIGLSMYVHKHYILEMLKAGALSYLSKSCNEKEVLKAIRYAKNFKYYLPSEIIDIIGEDFIYYNTNNNLTKAMLSSREIEVLNLLSQGNTAYEISIALGISARTVESHRTNISNKTGFKTIAELARYAERSGLLLSDFG